MSKPTSSKEDALSTLALQIVQAASKADCTIQELAQLAAQDPAFAARLLHVVNAPVHGVSRRVADIRQATSLLGVASIQNIALALAVTDLVPVGLAGESLLSIGLRRGCAAQRIAEATKLALPGEAFTTGLLLDVGILRVARQDLEEAVQLARRPALARPTHERLKGHVPHPVSGAQLAKKWFLPDHVAHAISHHHDDEPLDHPLARVAWAAERVASTFEGGDAENLKRSAVSALERLGLSGTDCDAVLAELPALVRDAGSAFQRSVGKQAELDKVLSEASLRLVELNREFQDLLASTNSLLSQKERLIRDLEAANGELARMASTDGLTGVLNRRAFIHGLKANHQRALQERAPLSIILLDVDHFKKVNDTHGHQVGDDVLVAVASHASKAMRTGDIFGRYGGEEFAAVLPRTPVDAASKIAERIRGDVGATTFASEKSRFRVTASFGIAQLNGAESVEQLIARADAALYRAKDGGRDRICHG
ncbi:MAG: diguanylate cyclase [Myxococcales bacterium]|nr:diguanylate cyclase [Myxococcales bacterium]